ncbi:MAG: methyltransferase domain-containing protein, partial [Ktedonobacteraceae bacterium]|nr:methyltransferase domain-containing protein [Ktedonobacteraceae bacterium]
YPIVLSYIQAEALLSAKRQEKAFLEVSPDLGITTVTVKLTDGGVEFPGGEQVGWLDVERMKKATTNCFIVKEDGVQAIQTFSEYTNRVCSLLPTKRTPSMLIAGFTMHRIVDIDPMQDTLKKIATIAPITGRVLDTATGLGYTAIEAARTAKQVITIELDPGAQEIARLNPWSRDLFNNPKIEQIMGNAFEVVPTFEENSFERIIHDPPVFSLAGELYSGVFYQQLYRILKRGGRLFHYIGNLESKSSGTVTRGALKRLQEAGFTRVVRRPEAFGVVAYK